MLLNLASKLKIILIILNSEGITSCEGEEGGREHELMGQILLKPF